MYEHEDFGEIEVTWSGSRTGARSFLIAIQADLWTPAEEVLACVEWARNLQYEGMTRGGDAVKPRLPNKVSQSASPSMQFARGG